MRHKGRKPIPFLEETVYFYYHWRKKIDTIAFAKHNMAMKYKLVPCLLLLQCPHTPQLHL